MSIQGTRWGGRDCDIVNCSCHWCRFIHISPTEPLLASITLKPTISFNHHTDYEHLFLLLSWDTLVRMLNMLGDGPQELRATGTVGKPTTCHIDNRLKPRQFG